MSAASFDCFSMLDQKGTESRRKRATKATAPLLLLDDEQRQERAEHANCFSKAGKWKLAGSTDTHFG